MSAPLTPTEKARRRYAALQVAAERNGFVNWSSMLTAIKNGQALVVRVAQNETTPSR